MFASERSFMLAFLSRLHVRLAKNQISLRSRRLKTHWIFDYPNCVLSSDCADARSQLVSYLSQFALILVNSFGQFVLIWSISPHCSVNSYSFW